MQRYQVSVLLVLLQIQSVRCDLDRWALLNTGTGFRKIDLNQKALYAVTTSNELRILQSDQGFELVDSSTLDVAVNDDFEIWIVKTGKTIAYRSGTSGTNLVGTGTLGIPAIAIGVATGRHGLSFHYNEAGNLYIRTGFESANTGTSWALTSGANIVKVSCCETLCVCVANVIQLFSTRKLSSGLSPALPPHWSLLNIDTLDVSAKEVKTLWRVDTKGSVWQAINVFDSDLTKVAWDRRGYDGTKFKAISATNKIQFGLAVDNHIRVFTGCPIFDFEENSLQKWTMTGSAFLTQPVVSQETNYARASGKVGDRLIDTFSSRKDYKVAESASEATQGDHVTGTLTSPLFQITTDKLHFVIGGGSYPNNYVALVINGEEKLRSSGGSQYKNGPAGATRSGRYYWDVSTYKGKCASIKVYDLGTGNFGHTLFDDLRASPPCFGGMQVLLTNEDHAGHGTSGRIMTYNLKLQGFYTSTKRQLTITVGFPTVDNESYIYIEYFEQKWKKCNGTFLNDMKMLSSSVFSTRWHSMDYKVKDYLLSDISFLLVTRVYDHKDHQGTDRQNTTMTVTVNYSDEFVHIFKRDVSVKMVGNETAKLELNENFPDGRHIFVGENISYIVKLQHNYTLSLQRAYNVRIRLFLPPYMTLVKVDGMRKIHGDVLSMPSPSSHQVYIPELLLDDNRTLEFVMSVSRNPYWKTNKELRGEFVVNDATYCQRRSCTKSNQAGAALVQLVRHKIYQFRFSERNNTKVVSRNVSTRIVSDNGLTLIICGGGQSFDKTGIGQCFFGNATSKSWIRLSLALFGVLYYDANKMEIYGETQQGKKLKMFGERFEHSCFLTNEDWRRVVSISDSFLKPSIVDVSVSSSIANDLMHKWHCCG